MRLRSANRGNANNVWNVNSTGYVNNNNAYNANRSAPDYTDEPDTRALHSRAAPAVSMQGADSPAERLNSTVPMQSAGLVLLYTAWTSHHLMRSMKVP